MRIAVFSHIFTPEIGAPAARTHEHARRWVDAGHSVDVATCFPNHPVGKLYPGYELSRYASEDIDDIKVHRCWSYVTPNTGLLRRTLGYISYVVSTRLFGVGRLRDPDIVVGTSPPIFAAYAALLAAKRLDRPFVMEVRDLWPGVFAQLGIIRNRPILRLLERWELSLYRRATRIVAVTQGFKEDLCSRGVPAEKVSVIPNGADLEFWDPQRPASPGSIEAAVSAWRTSPNAPALSEDQLSGASLRQRLGLSGRFVVLYLGAHGMSQGLDLVLRSTADAHQDVVFLFVGEGAQKDALMRQAAADELDSVVFLNGVSKPVAHEFYRLADACLVPLRNLDVFNTFIPSKVFEIMAMARPIVGRLGGEAAEILTESGAGIVVGGGDVAGLQKAIDTLRADRPRARAMGQRGRHFVAERYSRTDLAARYLELLEEAGGHHDNVARSKGADRSVSEPQQPSAGVEQP